MTERAASPIEWLRRIGAGERVIKTALATGIAWWLGSMIPGVSSPYLAPLGALLVMQITIADSMKAATQRMVGVVIGVIVALILLQILGVSALTISLVIMLSLMTGTLLKLEAQGVSQVAVSALLVVAVGGESTVGFAYHRILETIIGLSVGVVVNFVFAPPSFLLQAQTGTRAHAASLADALQHVADGIRAGITPEQASAVLSEARASDAVLRAAQASFSRTETAHRFNIWTRDERPAVERLALAVRTLERVGMQSRGVIRTVDESVGRSAPSVPEWLTAGAFDGHLAELLEAVAAAVRVFPEVMEISAPAPVGEAFALAISRARILQDSVATNHAALTLPGRSPQWVRLGSVLADLDRITRELSAAAEIDGTDMPLPPATAPLP
jgi:uncharacterized membrane protein YgaE (UPF0421/DUF939 family)